MRILFSVVFSFLILVFPFFSLSENVSAALPPTPTPTVFQGPGCKLTTTPSRVTTNDKRINIKIEGELVGGVEYAMKLNGKYIVDETNRSGRVVPIKYYQAANKTIRITNVASNGDISRLDTPPFKPGNYGVTLERKDNLGAQVCTTMSFPVERAPAGTTVGDKACTIQFLNTNFTSSDQIQFKISTSNTNDDRKVVLKQGGSRGTDRFVKTVKGDELADAGFTFGPLEGGKYFLEVQDSPWYAVASKTLCWASFEVCPDCTIDKTSSDTGKSPIGTSFTPKCSYVDKGDPPDLSKGYECITAIGTINTSPDKLISQLITFVLGFAGGVAVLLIIFSGYQMMISGGNPEKLQEAKDRLTSAIVGLVFIIFSLALLQIIGVDILGIPGFEP